MRLHMRSKTGSSIPRSSKKRRSIATKAASVGGLFHFIRLLRRPGGAVSTRRA